MALTPCNTGAGFGEVSPSFLGSFFGCSASGFGYFYLIYSIMFTGFITFSDRIHFFVLSDFLYSSKSSLFGSSFLDFLDLPFDNEPFFFLGDLPGEFGVSASRPGSA